MKKDEQELPTIFKIYKQAIANVPILKYSKVIIATGCILAVIAYLKLENATVFLYALAVIILSFLCFIFSLFLKNNDTVIKILRYFLVGSITVTTAVAILAFACFIIWDKPIFYKRWFPDQNISKMDSAKGLTVTHKQVERTINHNDPRLDKKEAHTKFDVKIKTLLSIQLKEETQGYSKIFIDGKQVPVLVESTKFNPRIEITNSLLNKKLLIVTNNGDTCVSLLPNQIDPKMSRFIPNCN